MAPDARYSERDRPDQAPGIRHRTAPDLRTESIDKLEEIRVIHRAAAIEVKARVGTAIRIHEQEKIGEIGPPVAVEIGGSCYRGRGNRTLRVYVVCVNVAIAVEVNPQHGVLDGSTEIPGIVVNAITVQIQVPVEVDASVPGGRHQLHSRLAGAAVTRSLPGGPGIPIAIVDAAVGVEGGGVLPHQPTDVAVTHHLTGRVAGSDDVAVAATTGEVEPHESTDVAGTIGLHVTSRVAGGDDASAISAIGDDVEPYQPTDVAGVIVPHVTSRVAGGDDGSASVWRRRS